MATGKLARLRAAPLGMLALLGLAAALYIVLLVTSAAPLEGGEAAYSQAWGALLLTFWLWVVLALALVVGAVMGRMPRAAGFAALLLHLISGVAAFVAIDAVSRHVQGALAVVALLPPLIAFYALWARLPSLRSSAPAGTVGAAVWVAVALLSAGAFATGL
ncbi:MAG: hypothetical protein ABSF67_18955 [Roseiarcus sp.]